MNRPPVWLIGITLAFMLGMGLGIRLGHGKIASSQGKDLAEVKLASGAVVLHHNPKTPAPSIGPLPHGYKVRTIAQVDLAPAPIQSGKAEVQTLTVAQVDTKEGPRIVVQDQGGRIVGGAAWDVGPPAPEYHWSVQAIREQDFTGHGSWGAELAHYRGPMVVSVAVTGSKIQAGIGWRW